MGAWIEIPYSDQREENRKVAPLVGAWIEIPMSGRMIKEDGSLPSWERGLKLL